MENLSIIILFLFVLFTLLGTGVWVGLALMGVAWVGMELFTSRPVGDVMLTTIWSASSSWTLTALPLFIWMGEILFRTRLSQDMFTGLLAVQFLRRCQAHLRRHLQQWERCQYLSCESENIPNQ